MAGNAREIVEGSVPRIPLSNPAGARLRRERSRFVLLPGGDQRDPKLAAHSSVNRVRRADCDEGRYPLNGMFCLWLLTRNTSDRTGAAGVTGSTTVAKGKPDGYTLLLARVGSQVAVSAINRKIPYKWDEFTFLGLLELNPFVLVVNAIPPSSPWTTSRRRRAAATSSATPRSAWGRCCTWPW